MRDKRLKRISCCVLATLMLLLPLSACSSKDNDQTDKTVERTEVVTETNDGVVAPTPYMDDFQGFECRFVSDAGAFESDDITGTLTGSVLSKATYGRNMALEEKYHFVITEKRGGATGDAQRNGAAGEHVFDVYALRMNQTPQVFLSGYICNLNDVKWFNLDAPYFDQSVREQATFANRLFFLTGDMLYMDDMTTYALWFNSQTWSDLHLTSIYGKDLYTLVRDNEWTFEKYKLLCEKATFEKDGEQGITSNDHIGSVYSRSDVFVHSVAMNNDVLTKDSEDILTLNNSSKVIEDLMRICELFSSSSFENIHNDREVFMSGHSLFQTWHLMTAPTFLEKGVDFGIVPHPMADDGQESYRSFVYSYGANTLTIPTTAPDKDKIANIIELISYESMTTLKPAFEEYIFGGRIVNHADDLEMLKILMSNKKVELAYMWKPGDFYERLEEQLKDRGTGLTGVFASSRVQIDAIMQDNLKKLLQAS